MLHADAPARMHVDQAEFADSFGREPFGFAHTLSGSDLFSLAALRALADKYADRDYFVAASAAAPGTDFYSVAHGLCRPREALMEFEHRPLRILMKRPETYDRRYARVLHDLFDQVVALRGGLRGERIVRLDGSILISSAAAITPFHFDPEVSFFYQIAGDKVYHLYSPAMMSESELERFYVKGVVNVGAVSFERRDPLRERTFALAPNRGLHQPQNCPHWVETRATTSISYVFSFETDGMRARGRTRSFNHYLRKTGIQPAVPGTHPSLDALKAGAMQAFIPARKGVRRALGAAFRR